MPLTNCESFIISRADCVGAEPIVRQTFRHKTVFKLSQEGTDGKPTKNIKEYGRMEKDWLFVTDRYICDLRAAGVLIRNNKILVQCEKGIYALPGGHVKIGETSSEALVREYKEETGADVRCIRFLWSEECFWIQNGRKVHNIAFYYLIELCDNAAVPDENEFKPHKDNDNVTFGWLPLEKLREVVIYPEFLKDEIHNLNEGPKHFVSKG